MVFARRTLRKTNYLSQKGQILPSPTPYLPDKREPFGEKRAESGGSILCEKKKIIHIQQHVKGRL
jgi:hypothetical protein